MSFSIPTFQDLKDLALSAYETALSVTAPIAAKAFLRVLSVTEGALATGLYKYAADQTKENLATTASITGLRRIGGNVDVNQIDAIAAQLEITLPALTDTVIPINTAFIGDANGLRYLSDAEVTAVDDVATIEVTCVEAGIDGNLVVDDTLTILVPIDDAEQSATVTDVLVTGLDIEDTEDYRRRVLTEQQTVGGGSNLADFRTWAEQTPGAYRAFPYAGDTPTGSSVDFIDLDMEEDGTAAWGVSNALLTKETSDPYEGLQFLRSEVDTGTDAWAWQVILTVGVEYTIRGVARGDGTAHPEIYHNSVQQWQGTTSTDWQEFEFTVTGEGDGTLTLGTYGGAGQYCDFDNIEVVITEYPGHVTVYVEGDDDVYEDGIPSQDLLDDVRAYLNYDQETGKARPTLGLTDENLFVEPIIRTGIYIEIRGVDVDAELLAQAKTDIEADVDAYLRNATPYIQGLDAPSSQADQITDPLLSRVIQDVLLAYGGTCNGIGIGIESGVFLTAYSLGPGELAYAEAFSYVG